MRSAAHCILAAIALAAIGCARQKHTTTPAAGDYPRSSLRMIEGKHDLPVPTEGALAEAFPTSMKVDNSASFAVESGAGRMSGKYHIERDSIFFDQYKGGDNSPVFAGRAFDDTIVVRWLTAAGDEPVPASTAVQLTFVRTKTRQTRFVH